VDIKNRTDLGRAAGPRELRALPIHRWFVYPHSFGNSLVNEMLNTVGATSNSFVWDPFLGAGTTLVICRQHGLKALGTDILPLSIVVSRAKVCNYDLRQLETGLRKLSKVRLTDSLVPQETDITLLKKAFSPQVRSHAHQIYQAIFQQVPSNLRPFFLTALVSIYRLFGSYVCDGGWPRLTEVPKRGAQWLLPDFLHVAESMIGDVREQSSYFRQTRGCYKARLTDFRSKPGKDLVDVVITSPPYLNKHDYTRLFAPELSLLGLSANAELTNLRYHTVRSHVEAKPHRRRRGFSPSSVLSDIIPLVQERASNSNRVPWLINGYFEDMFDFLEVCSVSLKSRGYLCLVVSNVQFYGILIPVDEILSELASFVNLRLQEKWFLRWRGNSSQQMAKYGRNPVAEWVLIWQKE
jgi:tRNA G10  N-methylase Trm11